MPNRFSFRSSTIRADTRPSARGKFIWVGDEKLYVRGVTYGTFRPDASGNQFYNLELIKRDFAAMAANRINSVRVYTTPPRSVLDLAQQYGLRVIVDLAADQYVGFLTDRKGAPDIGECRRLNRIGDALRAAGYPTLPRMQLATLSAVPISVRNR